MNDANGRRVGLRSPTATPAEVARELPPFPTVTAALPIETAYPDWRQRLTRNLARRMDSRWDALTRVHAAEETSPTGDSEV